MRQHPRWRMFSVLIIYQATPGASYVAITGIQAFNDVILDTPNFGVCKGNRVVINEIINANTNSFFPYPGLINYRYRL